MIFRAFPAKRRGFTLVELLVVISIVTVLAAIALPTLKNSLREQRVSRAAGLVQQYIEEARARAISTGRPYGVILERSGTGDATNRAQVTRLKICAGPPPYVGDLGAGKATVIAPLSTNLLTLSIPQSQALLLASAAKGLTNAINIGDAILIGHEQFPCRISAVTALGTTDSTTPITLQAVPTGVSPFPVLSVGQATSFAIIRQPVESFSAPLEIPDKTVIDLVYSGVGPNGTDFSPLTIEGDYTGTSSAFAAAVRDYLDVWIVFGPDGSIKDIYQGALSGGAGTPIVPFRRAALSDVYLLVGRAGQVRPDSPLLADSDIPNIFDGQAAWITINRMSGNAASSPIAVIDMSSAPITIASTPQARVSAAVNLARKYAKNAAVSQ